VGVIVDSSGSVSASVVLVVVEEVVGLGGRRLRIDHVGVERRA
jgi:hypothetical protein